MEQFRNIIAQADFGFAGVGTADLARFAALVLGPPLAIIALAFAQGAVEPDALFRDPVAVMRSGDGCCDFYKGAISNLGVVLWAMTGAFALLTASLLGGGHKAAREFFLATGALTICLMIDDLFMLHDEALPALGVHERAVMVVYLAAAGLYGLAHLRTILAGHAALAIGAAGFLGLSLGYDQVKGLFYELVSAYPRTDVLIEDGAKFLGITLWCWFVALRARTALIESGLSKS